jgi:hypothetical protein
VVSLGKDCTHLAWRRGGSWLLLGLILGFSLWISTATSLAAGLPDGRVYEQVSPANKSGNAAGATANGLPAYSLAAPDEGYLEEPRMLFGVTGPVGASSGGVDRFSVATRSAAGWSASAVLPRSEGLNNLTKSIPGSFEPSADLSRFAFTTIGSFGKGARDTPFGSATVYLAGENKLTSESEILAWLGKPTIEAPEEPDPVIGNVNYPARINIAGSSLALGSVYFTYYGTLTTEDMSREGVLKEHGGANSFPVDWGFYEWNEERGEHGEQALRNAGELPPGSPLGPFDPYGAVPAATLNSTTSSTEDFHNQVSRDGTRAFFVSPDPEAGSGRPPQLYVREREAGGGAPRFKTVLVSKDTLLGLVGGNPQPAPDGPLPIGPGHSCRGASAECLFYVAASADGSRAFFASDDRLTEEAPEDATPKEYEFSTNTGQLQYLPGVTPSLVAVSDSGSEFLFENTASSPAQLDLWAEGHMTKIIQPPTPAQTPKNRSCPDSLCIAPVRIAAQGTVVVFETEAMVPGFNDAGGFEQIYRFDLASNALQCVSCAPPGVPDTGDAVLSNDAVEAERLPIDSRGVSSDGRRVFFDTPDSLVPQDINGVRDVYEWDEGEVHLISGGTGSHGSYFLDNNGTGNDVFFTTTDSLAVGDTDEGYDVYDARIGGSVEPPPLAHCTGEECQGAPTPPPALGLPTSTTFVGAGDLTQVAGDTVAPKAKPKSVKRSKGKKSKRKHRSKGKAKKTTAKNGPGFGRHSGISGLGHARKGLR